MLKPYRTIEDVLKSSWAQTSAEKKSTETSDRVLRSTRLEDAIYQDHSEGDEELEEIEQEARRKLKSFPALSRDIYQSFYSLAPRKVDEAALSVEAKKFNSAILTRMTEQDDYPTLKNVCEGRDLLSYEAATEFISRTAENLDDFLSELGGDQGTLSTLEKLEAAKKQQQEVLSELLEKRKNQKQPDEALDRAILAAANRLDSKTRQVDAVSKLADTAMLRQMERMEDALGSAVAAAKEKAEQTQRILASWSDEPGDISFSPTNRELLKKVRSSPNLIEVAKYLGRFREILAQCKKNGYAYGRGEKYSLELGNDLSRALTSEFSMLASPETVPLFLRKYQQKQIKQYKRREPVFKGMGDIICCIDESSSTEGDCAAWAKAVALALLDMAAEHNRRFAMLHFSGPGSFRTDLFVPERYTVKEKMAAAEVFLGGGTSFETPMREAVRLMEECGFENADIVFITDGECELPEDCLSFLHQEQTERHFTVTGILLDKNNPYQDFSLKPFCQNIYRTSELTGEDIVRNLVS